jgi:hypothetical protein
MIRLRIRGLIWGLGDRMSRRRRILRCEWKCSFPLLIVAYGRRNCSCAGVPVILPYYGEAPVPEGWDLYHPYVASSSPHSRELTLVNSDKAQHGPAAAIGAPYVYSYHKDDVHGLYAAVRAARDNPIER